MSLLPTTKRARNRVRHHLWLAMTSLALTGFSYAVLLWFYPDPLRWFFRWSLATGYISATLLAVTLSLGARDVLLGRARPVSNDLRRDTGIWCAVFGLIHVLFGANTHLKSWTQYFVSDAASIRTDLFGLTNYIGAAAIPILVVMLATSNDFSLRRLGRSRWKAVQRLNYLFVMLVAAHSFIYQIVEKRLIPYGIIFGGIALWVVAIQFAGFKRKRRELQEGQ